jgi:riboflavin transporter FmnP
VQRTSTVAVVAAFSALAVGSDFALAPYPNVKLMDTIVFLAAFLFGFRAGAGVAVVSELAWSFLSPWGAAGAITPFLVGGELLFAGAGWWSSKTWRGASKPLSAHALFMGAMMLVCAFFWDLETNAATALLADWPSLTAKEVLAFEGYGLPFALLHEVADFLFGMVAAPVAILAVPKARYVNR